MKNLLIIWAWEWIGKNLISLEKDFDRVYTISRWEWIGSANIVHIKWDVTWQVDLSNIEKDSVDLVVYIPSLRSSDSDISEKEFEDYMKVGPAGLLKIFHALKDCKYLKHRALFSSIGSTASESALNCISKWGSGIYDISKLAQKSLVIQLMHCNKSYRFLNLTLGSIWDGTGNDWGVWYENIVNTISHIYNTGENIRYSEVSLISQVDVI